MSTEPSRRPQVLVLVLNRRVPERVVHYADFLLASGVEVDLMTTDENSAREAALDPRVRVHPVIRAEGALPVRRVERLLLYRLPGGTLARARRLTGRSRLLRGPDWCLQQAERLHRRLARAVHMRIFMPVYRVIRPWLLANAARPLVRRWDATPVDRIVAADLSAITLGCRLARRHPGIPATNTMDRSAQTPVVARS